MTIWLNIEINDTMDCIYTFSKEINRDHLVVIYKSITCIFLYLVVKDSQSRVNSVCFRKIICGNHATSRGRACLVAILIYIMNGVITIMFTLAMSLRFRLIVKIEFN